MYGFENKILALHKLRIGLAHNFNDFSDGSVHERRFVQADKGAEAQSSAD